MIQRLRSGMSQRELRDLLETVKRRLAVAVKHEPLDSPLVRELFEQFKQIKQQLGEIPKKEELH